MCYKIGIEKPIAQIRHYNNRELSTLNQQTDWILDDNGNIMVDFIGRVENIEEDLKKCFDIIGIKTNKIPHINKTKHNNYRQYYNETTQKIVKEIYKKDIDFFNYKF